MLNNSVAKELLIHNLHFGHFIKTSSVVMGYKKTVKGYIASNNGDVMDIVHFGQGSLV